MKRIFLALLLAFAAVSICTLSVSAQQIAAKKDGNAPGFRGVAAGKPAAAATDPSYVIGPEDVLSINVWHEPELSSNNLPVRPDGKISLPLLNDVQAAGLTPSTLSGQITEKLKKFVSVPEVTVVVTSINSQRIYMVGSVARPGVYPLIPDMTVLQALSSAGGLQQYANAKKIYVLRKQNGATQKIPFNYKRAIRGEQVDQEIELLPGDTIVVP